MGERTAEIGLVRALGATPADPALFLLEATLLSLAGGILGVAVGIGTGSAIRWLIPSLPFQTRPLFVAMALVVSVAVGLASGAVPARRAASLDPLEALRAE